MKEGIKMEKEKKYYNYEDLMKFLGMDYKFKNYKDYPFNRELKDFTFMWPIIIIPRQGVEKIIQNKISDIEYHDILKEIVMLVQIPYILKGERQGIINQDVSLSFRYDKEYKYGDINKSLPEVCYFIERHATKTNNFYIFDNEYVFDFMSYFVIDNQWGIGATISSSQPTSKFDNDFIKIED